MSNTTFSGMHFPLSAWLPGSPAIFMLLAAATLIGSTIGILRYSGRRGAFSLKALAGDYAAVLFCFAALLLTLIFVALAAWCATPTTESFAKIILQGITGSLAEDLVFFSLLGFMIVLVQRREADLNRNLEDKIDLLFSAKKLRPGEVEFLKNEVRRISADCQTLSIDIDVMEEDVANGLVRIDVSRRWLVASYLASETALYAWRLRISADEVGGHHPAVFVFPAYTTVMTKASDGSWQHSTEDDVLHPGGEIPENGSISSEEQVLEIRPGQGRELRTRFQGWQPLFARSTTVPGEGYGPAIPEPDTYRLKMERHWDEVELSVRNSLKRKVRVTISTQSGRILELEPGERKARAYRGENLNPGSHVYVSFALL